MVLDSLIETEVGTEALRHDVSQWFSLFFQRHTSQQMQSFYGWKQGKQHCAVSARTM